MSILFHLVGRHAQLVGALLEQLGIVLVVLARGERLGLLRQLARLE
jgi:hypothetical protein